jgi:hypothetical protein
MMPFWKYLDAAKVRLLNSDLPANTVLPQITSSDGTKCQQLMRYSVLFQCILANQLRRCDILKVP